ncbi:hypothetical protein SSS_02870 [Sarcoptes scabiei]|nr:hypothetical protein SSS_02870 [Sarcoptes scabiei]
MVEQPDYDHNFIFDINKQMAVPSKIKAFDDQDYTNVLDSTVLAISQDQPNMMQVPECIRVAGDTHITTNRQPPIEMKLEDELFGKTNLETQFQLSTPPRTLRYQDTVPIFAEPIQKLDQVLTESLQTPNQSIDESFMRRNKPNESTIVESNDTELMSNPSMIQIRRRLLQLSNRIDALEMENYNRNKRDMIIFAIGAIILFFRGLNWFARE